MSSYYYFDDPNSEFGSIPVPEEDYFAAILRIARRKGIKITDKLILKELEEMEEKDNQND